MHAIFGSVRWVQSLITKKHPEVVFCAIEMSGDGAVNIQSRVQMFLFKARAWSLEEARIRIGSGWKRALNYPRHRGIDGTGANLIQRDYNDRYSNALH